ncbi:MAG TPA: T9SS type A sorting domain-containing protein [Cyclobacteriaceae bacterium]|nr:T9SS type A sorting domain-containing protein [Cyclobacteriaceae bacterium]
MSKTWLFLLVLICFGAKARELVKDINTSNSTGAELKELFRYPLLAPKTNQTITFPAIAGKLVTDAPFNANATASSGLPVQYSSSDEAVATISSGGLITIHASGSTTITANQPGDENFNPATSPVTRVLFVDKLSQTINVTTIPAKKVGDAPFQVVASATSNLALTYSSSDETVASISSTGLVTIKKTGQTIIGFAQAGNETYHPASKQVQLDIGRASQTITFPQLDAKTFGDGPFQAQATASSGLAVVYTSANTQIAEVTQSGEITIVKAGVTQITALQSGDDTYNAATSVVRDIVINKADQIITFQPLPTVLASDDDFFVEAESSSGLPVQFTSSDESVATISADKKISILAAGTTKITAVQPGGDNYNPSVPVIRTLTVKSKGQTITLVPINDKLATDDAFFATGFSSSGLPVTFASFDPGIAAISQSGLITILAAGTATIIASQEGNDVYAAADPVTVTFKITKAPQEITFPAIVSINDGSGPFGLNATASSGLTIVYKTPASTEARVVVNGNLATTTGVGHASITATQPGNAKYAAAQDVTITFCVNPRRPTITVTQAAEKATLRSSATTNNSWTLNGDPLGLTTQEITVTKDGVYKVRTSEFNCISDFSEAANIKITAIEDAAEVSLFPNPVTKTLVIKSRNASMQILDTFGRTQVDQKLNEGETQIDVSSLSAGVYFVVIDNTRRLKFVKQ